MRMTSLTPLAAVLMLGAGALAACGERDRTEPAATEAEADAARTGENLETGAARTGENIEAAAKEVAQETKEGAAAARKELSEGAAAVRDDTAEAKQDADSTTR